MSMAAIQPNMMLRSNSIPTINYQETSLPKMKHENLAGIQEGWIALKNRHALGEITMGTMKNDSRQIKPIMNAISIQCIKTAVGLSASSTAITSISIIPKTITIALSNSIQENNHEHILS